MATFSATTGELIAVDDKDLHWVTTVAWMVHQGYVCRSLYLARKTSLLSLHNEIARAMKLEVPPGHVVNHRDWNPLNNKRRNLDVRSHQQNTAYARKTSRPTSSKYKGVYWNARVSRWIARITHDGRARFLGQFTSETDAARAYDAAALSLRGSLIIPALNFPDDYRPPTSFNHVLRGPPPPPAPRGSTKRGTRRPRPSVRLLD